MNSASFDLQTISNRIFHFWWILIFGGLMGSIFGLIANRMFVKPIYVADASISILINFKEVGHLTQYEQDQMIGHVKSFFNSSEVIQNTVLDENKLSMDYDLHLFKEDCFLEQEVNEIIFRCINTDPQIAMDLANKWSEISYSELTNAYDHAKIYQSLTTAENEYEKCIELSSSGNPSFYECKLIQSDDSTLEKMTSELKSEYEKSKGIFPGLTFTYGSKASLPKTPVRYQTNTMVFFAGMAGMIIAFLAIIIRLK